MRRTIISLFAIVTIAFTSCGDQPAIEPIDTDSIPKVVEDSAAQIIDRANKHLEDSGHASADSAKTKGNH